MIALDDLQAVADKQRKAEERRSLGLPRKVEVSAEILKSQKRKGKTQRTQRG